MILKMSIKCRGRISNAASERIWPHWYMVCMCDHLFKEEYNNELGMNHWLEETFI